MWLPSHCPAPELAPLQLVLFGRVLQSCSSQGRFCSSSAQPSPRQGGGAAEGKTSLGQEVTQQVLGVVPAPWPGQKATGKADQ